MHETSALWKQIFEEPDHQKQIKATINGTGYDEGQIISVSVSGRLFNAPGVGNAVSRTMEMELIPHSGARGAIPPLSEIRLFARLVSADGERVSEYISKGVFYADTVVKDTDTGTATITAFDALTKAELPFDPTASGGQSGGTTRTCTVSFNDGYGNVQKFHPRIGDPMPTPTTPTHEDERFLSWNPNPAATPTVRRDMLFMASWERKFTVIFESGDETPQTFSCFAGEATPTPETPTKDGYSFHEWLPTPAATVTEDVTYTAQWAGMTSAAITAYPVKSDYFTGETLDYAGLTVTATYSDGATRDITSECALRPAEGTEVTEAGDIMVDIRYHDKSLSTFWVAVTEQEAEVIASGDGWTLYGTGLLDIHCVGDMPDYPLRATPWYDYRTQITSAAIANSVTSIGNNALCHCTGLTSVTIPDGVTSIGESAFITCTGLTSVTIPDSVTSIGESAFCACSGLTSITIPSNVTSIGFRTFYYCINLTSVTIPSGVTSIDEGAFLYCTGLTSVTIPDSVTSIEYSAFYHCSGLADVYYGGTEAQWNAIEIGDYNTPLLNATIHYNSSPA